MAFVHLSLAARNAAAKGVTDLIDGGAGVGTLKIYDGTAPTTGDALLESQNLITTHNFLSPPFDNPSSGSITAFDIADGVAPGTGGPWTATWGRIEDSNGNNVMDIDVGVNGTTLTLNTNIITTGATVSITAGSFSMPSGT